MNENLKDLQKRWDGLSGALSERQQRLERALLEMGQFEQAYAQLMAWIGSSKGTLEELKPAPGDLRATEIQLAKHRVIANDVSAHEKSLDTINDAGKRLLALHVDENPQKTQGPSF